MRFTCIAMACVWALFPATLAAAAPTGARAILDATGVRGGLVVHVGCGDGKLTAALRANERYLVHGLDTDADKVAAARKQIRSRGLYGKVSVETFDGTHQPYTDGLVNLLVAGELGTLKMDEVMRVLAPRGVAMIGGTKTVKPWPANIDEWTHFLHGPGNNAVAADSVVGPPARLQWLADPMHLRSHEHLNSVSAVVSARGRIFTIIDEGPVSSVAAQPKWRLVARDAFNGLLLWKRDIGPWEGHFRVFRSGPPEVARRLVAVGDRVYATLGYGKCVAAFDAATGETVRTYNDTQGAVEIVCDGGKLFVVVGTITAKPLDPKRPFTATPAPRDKGIVAVDAATGTLLWRRKDKDTAALMPTTLAVSGGRVAFQNTRQVICLDAASGTEQWRADRAVYTTRLSWSAPSLVISGGVVLSADGSAGGVGLDAPKGKDAVTWIMSDRDIRQHPPGDLVAFDAATGKQLWTGKSLQGFCCPGDLLVIDGLVWAGANVAPRQKELNIAVDLRTGKIVRRETTSGLPMGGHARCYRDKATERFLVLGGTGVEFVDVKNWRWQGNSWVRGTCQYGVMPCNGLLYVPPDSCGCRPEMRLHGFAAMAPRRSKVEGRKSKVPQFEKGPAFGKGVSNLKSQISNGDWPTYRGDASRSGRTTAAVPARLKTAWRARIGGELTSLTAGAGKVFVSRVDAHTVHALDAGTGKTAWRRTVGGPVDSPPTVHRGRVIFGCRDGRVYCLRAGDGELAWRFRAAPEDRLIVATERVESAWPVSGSVLVREGLAWFVAGRSPYLDGGLHLYALEAASGKVVVSKRLNSRGPDTFRTSKGGKTGGQVVPPMLPDILSSSGGLIYMRWRGFDAEGNIATGVKPHVFSATGFLDDTWWHRTYWQWGTWMRGGFGGWPQAARARIAGRILAADGETIYGFGRAKYDPGNPKAVHAGHIGVVKDTYQDEGWIDHSQNPYRLFAASQSAGIKPPARRRGGGGAKVTYAWQAPVPMLVRGMVLAGEALFVAGPPAGQQNRGLGRLQAASTGLLWAVSAADGKKLAATPLPAPPVFDGLIAAGGRLYMATTSGEVLALGKDQ